MESYVGFAPPPPKNGRLLRLALKRLILGYNPRIMSNKRLIALAAAFAAGLSLTSPALAGGASSQFYGTVTHVSESNIKVKDPQNGQELGFVLTPHFNHLFWKNGKNAQMKFLQTGTPVEVIYDQKALGIRHADKVILLRSLGKYK